MLVPLFSVMLGLAAVGAADLTAVYKFPAWDFAWPEGTTEERRNSFGPLVWTKPHYIAVHGDKLFVSFWFFIPQLPTPTSLAWLSLKSDPSNPVKLHSFPSWENSLFNIDYSDPDCDMLLGANGIETDTLGRLWVVDSGANLCPPALRIFNTSTGEELHTHYFRFVETKQLTSVVLDETPDDWIAYIADSRIPQIVVVSLKTDQSWAVRTEGIRTVYKITLAPKGSPDRRLYISDDTLSRSVFSVPVSELRARKPNITATLVGNFTEKVHSLAGDDSSVLYAVINSEVVSLRDFTEPFNPEPISDFKDHAWPIPLTVDATGNLWCVYKNSSFRPGDIEIMKAKVAQGSYLGSVPS